MTSLGSWPYDEVHTVYVTNVVASVVIWVGNQVNAFCYRSRLSRFFFRNQDTCFH